MMEGRIAQDLINQYGENITIIKEQDELVKSKAFIQPLRLKDNKNIFGNYLNIGADNDNQYLYIGNPKIDLEFYPNSTIIETSDERYIVSSSEKIKLGADTVYTSAVLSKVTRKELG